MTSTSPRAHLSNFKYAIKIIEDCRDIWPQDQHPNIDQLLYDYELIDITGKIQDFKSYYQFRDALDHLTDYEFIKILIDSRAISRIYKGNRELPKTLTYEEYWSKNV
jgi:glutaredoxin-related protein